jgi:uncharacterized membrane protein YdfJ with MMPL/SSD domain
MAATRTSQSGAFATPVREAVMERLRRFDLSVLAWCLALVGTLLLMVSTVEPIALIPQLVLGGCCFWALSGVVWLAGLLLLRHGRRSG